MRRRLFTFGSAAAFLAASATARAAAPSDAEAASGIRAALERGASEAVGLLGQPDGFLGNPKVRIPLPKYLESAAKMARFAGQQQRVDELVTAMNRAAEAAVPLAKTLLVDAVKSIGIADAWRVVSGGDGAVTRFFADKTRAPLGEKFLPIVKQETERVDLAARFNAVAGKAAGLGLMKGEPSIEHYVTEKALDGLYFMIGEQEKKIRADPVGTGSAILARVFGR
ncbi:MAG: DUF4197 domain-containing protein [Pseudomonadota bacterium]|nr:DUF4197 domain-containing protein [Pseudomonadota bacterium]